MNNNTAKLLVSFTNAEASKHYFCATSLGGGEAAHLCTLPGCDKNKSSSNNSPCTCYVSGVVNGVLCFSNGKDVYVLNLATSEILTLPRSDGYEKLRLCNVNLSYSAYAFGFDPSKQEYKVLHVFGVPQCPGSALLHNQQCEIFTIRIKKPDSEKPKEVKEEKPKIVKKEVKKEGRKHKGDKKDEEEEEEEEDEGDVWRKAASLPPCPYMFRGQGVFVNGSIYWLGVSSPGEDAIVCFDVESEIFRSIPIPFTLPYRSTLSHVRGRLAIQGIEKTTGSSPTLGVWILEDMKESKWNKNTVEIVDPKVQKGVKFHVLVGDDSTGDMVVMRSILPERYEVVCLSGNKNTAAERTISLGGLPSWVDLQRGNNLNNFRIDNYVESRVDLDPIVIKVKKEKKPSKEDGIQNQNPPRAVASQPTKKTYYQGRGQRQTQQFSRGSQYVQIGYGQARGAQSQQFSRATQSVQRKYDGRAQPRGAQAGQTQQHAKVSQSVQKDSPNTTSGAQAAQQPPLQASQLTQKTHNGSAQPSATPPPPATARTISYGRAQPPPMNHGARPTYIRIGEFDVQVS